MMLHDTCKAVSVCVLGTLALLANISAAASDKPSPVYETQDDVRATKVTFDDLNLNRQAGAETLYHRLEAAARRVCGSPTWQSAYPDPARDQVHCHSDALQRAVDAVDNTYLTELHMKRTGRQQDSGEDFAAMLQ